MISRQRLAIIISILVLSLALAACVRPVPGSEDGSQEPTPASGEQANTEPGYPAPVAPAQPQTDSPYPGAADTPRLELGSTEAYPSTEDPAAQPLDEPAADDTAASEETTDSNSESGETTEGSEAMPEDGSTEEAASETEDATDETAVADTETLPYIEHVVQPSQTLYNIGLVYGFSWVVLAQYNDIANPDALAPGDVVRIPTLAEIEAFYASETAAADNTSEASAETTEAETETAVTESTEYVVQADDNLYSIALQFGLSWVDIAQANGLSDATQIEEGQVLIIPAAGE